MSSVKNTLPPADFLQLLANRPILDVRSPGEFAQGHIPGAISFPLFTDEERAEVGIAYKNHGNEAAFELGLRRVGPKMADFVKMARKLAPGRQIAVHCWRGGQRSGSMAWLLRQAGFQVVTLEGGYKAYRQLVLQGLATNDQSFVVLGGRTGSGKTKILKALASTGAQVVDLEGLAHHKGSAFGFIGELEQPSVEQFENNLFEAVTALDKKRICWIENESHSIGRVFVPLGFMARIKTAPLVNIEIPQEARIQNLLDDYVQTDPEQLKVAFKKIERKLGGLQLKTALEHLSAMDYGPAARIALQYYDKTYQHGLDTSISTDVKIIPFEYREPDRIATVLRTMYPD